MYGSIPYPHDFLKNVDQLIWFAEKRRKINEKK